MKVLFLCIEPLEDRQMLSTLQVMAAGTSGSESFDLLIDEQIVSSFELEGIQPQSFLFETIEALNPEQIRIAFTNDGLDAATGLDRNLIIDKIQINGVAFESEDPSTFSTGSYTSSGLIPGNWKTEYLHTNGFFQYSLPTSSTIEIIAAGATGEEEFRFAVNGETMALFGVSTSFESYFVQTDFGVDPSQDIVRVEFLNDLFVEGQVDRDLLVDKVIIDSVVYESESPNTYSTGTWVGEGIPHEGFLNSNTLHVIGYFEYQAATDIKVRAAGDEGNEQIRLRIDGATVATFDLTTDFQEYTYRHFTKIDPSQIRVEFFDDQYNPDIGLDKNANVDWIEIQDERFETESPLVYSNGTYLPSGLAPGFGRGQTLHTSGFFQFGIQSIADSFSIPEDAQSVPLAVLANDRAPSELGIEFISQPTNGSVELVNGEILYTPNANFDGIDNFLYRLQEGSENISNVEINVRNSHQQPQSQINSALPMELTPSGKTLLVEKLVKLPLDDNGSQPRANMLTTFGNRIFVVTDGAFGGDAKIYEIVSGVDGTTSVQLFLDVRAAVENAGFEIDDNSPLNGLRSVAFHPDFDTNGKFYVTYVGKRPSFEIDTFYISNPENPIDVESVLAEFTFDFQSDAVDTSSYREVFRVGMPVNDHPIRQAIFNPFAQIGDEDYGLLYIGHGDGSEQSAVAGDGQNGNGLGKILRIDPLAIANSPFTAPATNPYIGKNDFPDAVYAIGFRNPHNLTFALDATNQTRLIVTDIGRDNIEEINVVVPGGNYGWADREGVFVHLNEFSGVNNNISNLPADEASNGYIYPISLFGHDGEVGNPFVGQALAGGHVIQNGSSELDDQFIFLEFATDGRAYHIDFSEALQQITVLDPDDPNRDSPEDLTWLNPQELTILFDHDSDPETTPLIKDSLRDVLDDEPDFVAVKTVGKVRADLRLGQGPNGELYIINKRNGWIYVAANTTN